MSDILTRIAAIEELAEKPFAYFVTDTAEINALHSSITAFRKTNLALCHVVRRLIEQRDHWMGLAGFDGKVEEDAELAALLPGNDAEGKGT